MGHVSIKYMVFVIAHYLYLLLTHNIWDMYLLSTWYLLLHIVYVYYKRITDGTCIYKVHGVCYCTLFMYIINA